MNIIHIAILLLGTSFGLISHSSMPEREINAYTPKKSPYKFIERFCFTNISYNMVYKHMQNPSPQSKQNYRFWFGLQKTVNHKPTTELEVLKEQIKAHRSPKAKK